MRITIVQYSDNQIITTIFALFFAISKDNRYLCCMAQNEYQAFLKRHKVDKISQLGKDGLLDFVGKFMDKASARHARELLDNPFGIAPDWSAAAKAVEQAYLSGKTFWYGFITGEACSFDKASNAHMEYFAR